MHNTKIRTKGTQITLINMYVRLPAFIFLLLGEKNAKIHQKFKKLDLFPLFYTETSI